MVVRQALAVPEIQKTQPEAPAAVGIRQPEKSVRNQRIVVGRLRLIAIAGLRDREQTAATPDR